MSIPYTDHPWHKFLQARKELIIYFAEGQEYSDIDIAEALSMTESQVFSIKNHAMAERGAHMKETTAGQFLAKFIRTASNMDEEDEGGQIGYSIFCIGKDGCVYIDRVYKSLRLAEKRLAYLNIKTKERGAWYCVPTEIYLNESLSEYQTRLKKIYEEASNINLDFLGPKEKKDE